MPIASTDILLKLSTKAGAAGNSSASTPAGSLGKYISTTQIADNILGNLFDDVSGAENQANTVDYRCEFIHNAHGTLTLQAPVAWISSEVAGGASLAISVDTTPASVIDSATAQAKEIATETTAPTGQTFSPPTTKGTGLALSDIPPGQCKALWLRRTAANTVAVTNDSATVTVEGDTLA